MQEFVRARRSAEAFGSQGFDRLQDRLRLVEMEERVPSEVMVEVMALPDDVLPQFREDACHTIYALIADALFRCTSQSEATRMIVKICSLPSSVPSLPPMYLLSVAHSGPGTKASELRSFFPQFSKSCYSTSSAQLGLRWGGVVRVLTSDAGDKDFHHYEIVMGSDSGFELIQLPATEYDTEIDSGTINEIIVTGSIHNLVDFSRSICEKTSMLKLKNVTLDFFLRGVLTDDRRHHIKGMRICDGIGSLEDFSAEELLCIGAVEYLSSCRCGFSEGSIADLRFRELVQVGKCQAGSSETKWCLDACITLIDVAMAEEIFFTIDSQTSVVVYFEDGCFTPAPLSVLKGLKSVKWAKFGLKIRDMQTVESGEVILQFEESRRISTMLMILHIQQNLKTPRRCSSPAGGRMVKTAVEACMTDLKARESGYFLSENALQMQQVATDVSECIGNIIFSSTNEDFREHCASIIDLPLQDLGEIENIIREKMVKIIRQHDGRDKRKPGSNNIGSVSNEIVLREGDEDPLYYYNEDEELL